MPQTSNCINPFNQTSPKKKAMSWGLLVIVGVIIALLFTGYKIGKKLALEDNKAEAQELVNK